MRTDSHRCTMVAGHWPARPHEGLTSATVRLIINAMVNQLPSPLSSPLSSQVDTTFAALADPTRRRVIELLQDGARRASEVADCVGTSRQAMSRHLKVLRAAGLVAVELPDDDGRGRAYRLRPDRLVGLQAWLDQVQARWAEQLASFKRHAEVATGRHTP
jgi:DNA-binding transcriptional ArsR family regulator